ncbi:aspartate/glutamate racemase family protein [Diplocloster hominis]|uniref:aspartate/glutamate racemase family protein n=1 Tax=Diplocloster hominis TaxID=3079010 RepID=UPI0031BA84C5
MQKKIAVIHTSLAVREIIDQQIRAKIPDADIHNIIDERFLQDVIDHNGIYDSIINRMCLYVQAAEQMQADVVLNACSSVGEAFDEAVKSAGIPALKIDEPMAEAAVCNGSRIAVYGTVATTLAPSCRLIAHCAEKIGKEVSVTPYLIEGAFQVLSEEKNPAKHNEMVLNHINETHGEHDVIVLAQASMSILIPKLGGIGKPVLYSLESGIARLKKILYD